MKTRSEIRVKGLGRYQTKDSILPFIVALTMAFVLFVFTSYMLNQAYDGAKGTFLERLNEEKKVAELNIHLKTELLAVTQKNYVEFVAEERLGLKKPREEEVLVLR